MVKGGPLARQRVAAAILVAALSRGVAASAQPAPGGTAAPTPSAAATPGSESSSPGPPAPAPPVAAATTTGGEQRKGALAVLQAANGTLSVTEVTTTRVLIPLTIEEGNGVAVKGLDVQLTPLARPSGGAGERLSFEPQGWTPGGDVPAYGQLSGRLVADLPEAGTYTASMRLVYDGKPQPPRLTVTIQRAAGAAPTPLPLDPGKLPPIGIAVRPCQRASVAVRTTLQSTGGKTVELAAPELRALTSKQGEVTLAKADPRLEVVDGDGRPLSFPLKLEPGKGQPVQLIVHGLDGAGKYEAEIRFSAAGHDPLDKTFDIYARAGMQWAWLPIFVGVLVSFAIRKWYTSRRPALALERRASLLEVDLGAAESEAPANDAAAREVIAALRAEIARTWARIIVDEKVADATVLDTVSGKVPLLRGWVEARLALREAKPPAVAAAVEEDMKGIERVLRSPSATAAEVKAQQEVLAGVPAKLRKAAAAEVGNRAAALSDEAAALAKDRPKAKDAIERDVKPLLAAAKQAAGEERFEVALAAVDKARRQLSIVLADDLAAELQGARPERVDEATWRGLQDRLPSKLQAVRVAATADEAWEQFKAALETYSRGIAGALREAARVEQTSGDKVAAAAAMQLLDDAERLLAAGKVLEAWRQVVAAHGKLAKQDDRARSALGAAAGAPASRLAGFLRDAAAMEGVSLPASSGPFEIRRLQTVTRDLLFGDLLVNVLILLIASLLGLSALWSPSLAWGGWADQLTAFVWGLGLHQVAYSGMTDLVAKIK